MEKYTPSPEKPSESTEEKPKHYLYHRVPQEGTKGDTLHPLNTLKDRYPDIYAKHIEKYNGREDVPQQTIDHLACSWGDVIQLTAVHPHDLKKALCDAGFEPQGMAFYQIDPDDLDPDMTTIYTSDDASAQYHPYDPQVLHDHSTLPEKTQSYYKEQINAGHKPFLFLGVPHIFHKGSINISECPIIEI